MDFDESTKIGLYLEEYVYTIMTSLVIAGSPIDISFWTVMRVIQPR